ncbi:MAG: hypothetical protein ACE5H5_03355 [Nitrospinota bacterium]
MVLASCAALNLTPEQRMVRAQTKVFQASYEEVFPVVVEVLARDYALLRVEPEGGAIETAPKSDVKLNAGEFQGVYNLKVRATVTPLEAHRTMVRLRVLAGQLLDFVENRWLYKDFGTRQYYREYFHVIQAAVDQQKGAPHGAGQQ